MTCYLNESCMLVLYSLRFQNIFRPFFLVLGTNTLFRQGQLSTKLIPRERPPRPERQTTRHRSLTCRFHSAGLGCHPSQWKLLGLLQAVFAGGIDIAGHSEIADLHLSLAVNQAVPCGQVMVDVSMICHVLHACGNLHAQRPT